jgi:exopolysaccharide biosynthesis polyprenyl glycosylphosphotransferase
VIREQGVTRLIVAYGGRGEADLVDGIRTVDRLDVDVAVVPRLYELHSARRGVEEVRGVPVVWMRRHGPRRLSWPLKRAFDIVVSTVALFLLAPVLLAAATAVRLEGGPGVIFKQRRVGLDGREFELLKLRSLRPLDEQESQTNWNISEDCRLGPVGCFIRRTSIDELPQLWNVLCGDMSLVGPRPERKHFVELFSAQFRGYPARHRVPAGLTGWAQAHGLRGDTSIEERARFDNYYIENWSLWLDVRILLMTVRQVLRRTGA